MQLSKYDGFETRPLTISEMKQIGGRAGRYGSEFPAGEVTAIAAASHLSRLRTALATPTPPVARAGVFPLLEQLEHFAAAMLDDATSSSARESGEESSGSAADSSASSDADYSEGDASHSHGNNPPPRLVARRQSVQIAAGHVFDADVDAMLFGRYSAASSEHESEALGAAQERPDDVEEMLIGRLAPDADAVENGAAEGLAGSLGADSDSGTDSDAAEASPFDARLQSSADPLTRRRANLALTQRRFSSIVERYFASVEVSCSVERWHHQSCTHVTPPPCLHRRSTRACTSCATPPSSSPVRA